MFGPGQRSPSISAGPHPTPNLDRQLRVALWAEQPRFTVALIVLLLLAWKLGTNHHSLLPRGIVWGCWGDGTTLAWSGRKEAWEKRDERRDKWKEHGPFKRCWRGKRKRWNWGLEGKKVWATDCRERLANHTTTLFCLPRERPLIVRCRGAPNPTSPPAQSLRTANLPRQPAIRIELQAANPGRSGED